jgi:hypothetical protein
VIKKIGRDKWKHFFVGIAMGIVLQWAGGVFLPGHTGWATAIALIIIIIISYGFELFSKFSGMGRYDVMDAVASILGGVAGMSTIWIILWINR